MTWLELLGLGALLVLIVGGFVVVIALLIGSGANPE